MSDEDLIDELDIWGKAAEWKERTNALKFELKKRKLQYRRLDPANDYD